MLIQILFHKHYFGNDFHQPFYLWKLLGTVGGINWKAGKIYKNMREIAKIK